MQRGKMLPPWLMFPDIPFGSIGWRMGEGEEYLMEWTDWYSKLSATEKAEFQVQCSGQEAWNSLLRL